MNIPSKKARGYIVPALFLICALFYLQLVSEIKHVLVPGAVTGAVKTDFNHNDKSDNLAKKLSPADSSLITVSAQLHKW